jgi:hypothetical protein
MVIYNASFFFVVTSIYFFIILFLFYNLLLWYMFKNNDINNRNDHNGEFTIKLAVVPVVDANLLQTLVTRRTPNI